MTENEIYQAVGDLIVNFTDADNDKVLQSNPNRAPVPKDDDFIYMFILTQNRQSTNIKEVVLKVEGETTTTENTFQPTRLPIQIDCYGPKAFEWATIITTILRDPQGTSFLENLGLTSLFSDDAKNLTDISLGSEQYTSRWMVQAEIQVIQKIEIEIETFEELENPELIEVYSTYPDTEE